MSSNEWTGTVLSYLPSPLRSYTPGLLVDHLTDVFDDNDKAPIRSSYYYEDEQHQPPTQSAQPAFEIDCDRTCYRTESYELGKQIIHEIAQTEATTVCKPEELSWLGTVTKVTASGQGVQLVKCCSCNRVVLKWRLNAHYSMCSSSAHSIGTKQLCDTTVEHRRTAKASQSGKKRSCDKDLAIDMPDSHSPYISSLDQDGALTDIFSFRDGSSHDIHTKPPTKLRRVSFPYDFEEEPFEPIEEPVVYLGPTTFPSHLRKRRATPLHRCRRSCSQLQDIVYALSDPGSIPPSPGTWSPTSAAGLDDVEAVLDPELYISMDDTSFLLPYATDSYMSGPSDGHVLYAGSGTNSKPELGKAGAIGNTAPKITTYDRLRPDKESMKPFRPQLPAAPAPRTESLDHYHFSNISHMNNLHARHHPSTPYNDCIIEAPVNYLTTAPNLSLDFMGPTSIQDFLS